jgi:hypothetical protein
LKSQGYSVWVRFAKPRLGGERRSIGFALWNQPLRRGTGTDLHSLKSPGCSIWLCFAKAASGSDPVTIGVVLPK